jgi:hypothetical protein
MSNTEDNTPIDNELKVYLAGEDGVSAAYRETGAEEPPAELDRLILAAAHSAVNNTVNPHVPRKLASLQQKLPIAASFMVGVLITSMYFRQTDDRAGNSVTSDAVQERLVSQSVEQPAPAPAPAPAFAPAAPPVTIEQEAQPEPLERVAPQQAEQIAQQAARSTSAADTQETSEVNKTAASQDLSVVDNATAAQDNAADAGATARGNVTRIATTAESIPPALPANFNETPTESDTAGQELEEIMVTGSRIRTEADITYREDQQEWLERILALGEDIIFQTDALEENNSRLEEEMELFSETYPDIDLEAELQKLMEE